MKRRLLSILLAIVMCLSSIQMTTLDTHAASSGYWIKVNKQANVATVYQQKDGEWVAIKAMLTSCGGSNTPTGTYYTKAKYRWHELYGPSWGQYCTRIVGGILFHSVWYYQDGNKKSEAVKEFNKLGSTASHGCVRLSVADAKWIYDNCSLKTKVTIYTSSNPGPLGKPAAYKMPSSAGKKNWDPTDSSSNNPYYKTLPVLTQKVKKVTYGSKTYDTAKKLVTAKQKNGKALKSLTITVKKYDSSTKKYVSAKYSSKSVGKYQIKYKAVSTKGVSLTKTFTYTVEKDIKEPIVEVTKEEDTVDLNTVNASQWLKTAKMQDGTNRMSATKVYVKAPGNDSYDRAMTYEESQSYIFNKAGVYTVKYVVSNKNKTSVTTSKKVKVTVIPKAEIPDQGEETTPENPGQEEVITPENPGQGEVTTPENPGQGETNTPENPVVIPQ